MLSNILKEKQMSVFSCSKTSDIPYTTLLELVKEKTNIKKTSAETLYKLSQALNISMEDLYKQCTVQEPYRCDFEAFKSSVCHSIKEWDEIEFIIKILESRQIFTYWERKWYPECFYLLAMVDYLSRMNDIPLCKEFDHIRTFTLEKPLYPRDVRLAAKLSSDLDIREKCLQEAIPEFLRFNIIESEIRNVC